MKFGIVVVTYNRRNLLEKCIEKITLQKHSADKVVIVNNNSTDQTRDFLDSLSGKEYIVINLDDNLGASGGFEAGLKRIVKENVDFVLLIDDDAHIDENYLYYINKYAEKYPDVKAFSGTVYENGEISVIHRRRIKNKMTLKDEAVSADEYMNPVFNYDLSSFCGLVIHKDVVLKIGYPRVDYFTQYTDTEYSLRVDRYTKIINVNKAFLVHKIKKVIEEEISYKTYYQVRNRIVTILNNTPLYIRPMLMIGFRCSYSVRICIKVYKILMQYTDAGYYQRCIKIFRDAVNDALHNKLGVNVNYLPKY